WAPIGIALALLIRFGTHLWPAVTLASFTASYFVSFTSFSIAAGLAACSTLSIYITAFTLQKLNFKAELQRQKDLYLFLKIGIITLPVIAAVLGVFTLYFHGVVKTDLLLDAWLSWLLGD